MRRRNFLMNPDKEISEMERLWNATPWSNGFSGMGYASMWGESIRKEVVDGIRSQKRQSLEAGILFLEVCPRYHRSGYYREWVARALKSAPLTPTHKERLRHVILDAIDSERVGPEFSEYARLAIVVADVAFIRKVKERPNSERGWVQNRFNRLLARLEQFCPPILTE